MTAAPIVWTGATSTDFANGNNWSGGVAPINDLTSDIATFTGSLTTNQPSVGAARTVAGLAFASGGWILGGTANLTLGSLNVTNSGDNTVTTTLAVNTATPHVISSGPGSTLTLSNVVTDSNNQNNLTIGTATDTGTVVLGGVNDNSWLSPIIAFGTVVMNKGTVGGVANKGSTFNNVTVNSGATVKYGLSLTDRNDATAGGTGQIYGTLTLNGTLDLNGTGVFSDNYGIGRLNGANTGVITNNGTGAGQLRVSNTNGDEFGFDGIVQDGTGTTGLYINMGGTIKFSNAANTFSGGVEIVKGFTRFSSDAALGTVPATPAVNIKMNGTAAVLQNNGGTLTLNANRNIFVDVTGGGFKAGWSSPLTVNGVISGTGPIKIFGDSGTVIYTGLNTHTGNTVLENSNSKFTLADDARMTFAIGTNNVSTQITGDAASKGTVTLNGDFNFDLTNAENANGNSWTIVDNTKTVVTHGPTFSVVGFTETADVWKKTVGTATYSYTESTGKLTVVGPSPNVTLTSAATTETGGTIVLSDMNGGSANSGGPFTFVLMKNGVVVDSTVTVSKTGTVTTVTFAAGVEGNTGYTYSLTFPVSGISGVTTKTITGTLQTRVLPATASFTTPDGSPGSWSIREYQLGGVSSLTLAYAATKGTSPQFNGTAPVLNHSDPDTNNARSTGNFNNDFPILSNVVGTAQDFVVVAKTKVTVPAAGDYTFSVHSDDGFAMRVTGGHFTSKNGSGSIDALDNQTIYLDGSSPDSSTRGVYHFDAAGTYDILYVGYDGGGGGYYEVAWAPGTFTEDRATNTWALVGSQTGLPSYLPRYVTNVPGPAGTAGNFGIRTYLDVTTATSLELASDFLASTPRLPTDADNKTVDAQRSVLNANDPQAGGEGGLILPDSPFPGDTSVAEDHVVTSAKGRITVATTGSYTFSVQADDGYILRIKGVGATPTPSFKNVSGSGRFEMSNPNEMFSNNPGNTRGIIRLAAGSYDVEFIHFENTGGFFYELASVPGEWPDATVPTDPWVLVGYTASTTPVIVPKIKAPGWTVESTVPGAYTIDGSIFTAEEALLDTSTLSPAPANVLKTLPELNFKDPQAPGVGGPFTPSSIPFPTDTAAADNAFAVRATGTVVITTAGEYYFGFQGDDGGYMRIKGGPAGSPAPFWKSIVSKKQASTVIEDELDSNGDTVHSNNQVTVTGAAADSRTVVNVDLVPGEYTIETLYYEIDAGAFWEVFGAGASDSLSPALPLLSTGGATTVLNPSSFPLTAQVVAPVNTAFNISGFTTVGNPITGANFTFSSGNTGTYAVQISTDLVNWTLVDAQHAPITVGTNGTSTVAASFTGLTINGQPVVGQPKLFVRVIRTF